jgi:hypothetical protein
MVKLPLAWVMLTLCFKCFAVMTYLPQLWKTNIGQLVFDEDFISGIINGFRFSLSHKEIEGRNKQNEKKEWNSLK